MLLLLFNVGEAAAATGDTAGTSTASASGFSRVVGDVVTSSGTSTTTSSGFARAPGVGTILGAATSAVVGSSRTAASGSSTGAASSAATGNGRAIGTAASTGAATSVTTGFGRIAATGATTATSSTAADGFSASFATIAESAGDASTTGAGVLSIPPGIGTAEGSAFVSATGFNVRSTTTIVRSSYLVLTPAQPPAQLALSDQTSGAQGVAGTAVSTGRLVLAPASRAPVELAAGSIPRVDSEP